MITVAVKGEEGWTRGLPGSQVHPLRGGYPQKPASEICQRVRDRNVERTNDEVIIFTVVEKECYVKIENDLLTCGACVKLTDLYERYFRYRNAEHSG